MSTTKLRDFISAVRKCKSQAEEAALVAKECANIRNGFQDPASVYRHRNIAKLMFINMMGYPTQFGQLETVKLLASPHFLEKKLGCTALPVLLDHECDVLMLATNTIKNDISSPNQYVSSAALGVLGNIPTADMAETLLREVEDIMGGNNPMLKKRANALIAKVIRHNPDQAPKFFPRLIGMFQERNHSMILGAVAIINAVLDSQRTDLVAQLLPALTPMSRYLNDLLTVSSVLVNNRDSPSETSHGYGYRVSAPISIEYDVNGVNDPILQTKILAVCRRLIDNYAELLEVDHWNTIVDMVQSYLPRADNYKNAAQAVVYEASRVALALGGVVRRSAASSRLTSPRGDPETDRPTSSASKLSANHLVELGTRSRALLDLAMEWLDFFISHKDNTHRYVAIATLADLATENPSAVKRYQKTVVDCLKDPDPSIQKLAVNLTLELMDSENAIDLTTELLNLLLVITDPMPAVQASRAPLGKDVAFTDGTHVVVQSPRNATAVSPAEREVKRDLTMLVIQKIERAIEWWAPSRSWQVDSLIRLCCLAGNLIGGSTTSSVVGTIMATPELHEAALIKLNSTVQDNVYQIGLCEVAVWAFGDLIGASKGHSFAAKDIVPKLEETMKATIDPAYIEHRDTTLSAITSQTTVAAGDLLADVESTHTSPTMTNAAAGSLANILEDAATKATDTYAIDSTDVEGSTGPITPVQAMEQIELIASVLGLADLRTRIDPKLQIKVQSTNDLVQNADIGGVAGRISDTCIISSPDPKTHEIKDYTFQCFPQAVLPKQTRDTLKESMLPLGILTASAKLAAKFPSLRPRVLRLLGALKDKCMRFEFQLRVSEFERLLSPEIFTRFGQDALLVRCGMPPRIGKRRGGPQRPVGRIDLNAASWPTRQSVLASLKTDQPELGEAEKAADDDNLMGGPKKATTSGDSLQATKVVPAAAITAVGGEDLLDDLLSF